MTEGNSGAIGVDDGNGETVGEDVATEDRSDDQGLGKAGAASDTLGIFIRG
jgi:hypothetical protein